MSNNVQQKWDRFWAHEKPSSQQSISWSKKRMMAVLDPLIEGKNRALDAGCGSGFFSKYFCDNGMDTTAVDYSPEALERAKAITDNRVRVQPIDLVHEKLNKALKREFDIIFTDGLFEHFSHEGQNAIMKNLISVLDKTGIIITFVPNRFSPWQLIRPFVLKGIEERPFIMSELIELNKRNSLNIVQKGGVNTLPVALSAEGKIAQYVGMLLFTVSKK
jgi:SAM-dependent methyltransferase